VTKHIASGLAAKLSTGMLLLDIEKAFDWVWHDALRHKLLGYRYSIVYIKLIWSFLTDRKFCITVAGERPAECEVPSGVPQGAVFSPTLFNIFTSDFPTFLVYKAIFHPDYPSSPAWMCLLDIFLILAKMSRGSVKDLI
jgi:hypothetical protein